ncbi:putative amino-acid permease [Clavispora lusitaniae]|uniref:Amino-acid permease n=2 Tax=Clavispora lusitaniae TaxID=36911 RepID=A0AA91Q2A1_CLALS|nr:putative amino-acid permease [Clavispora lusitaniae]QFZ29861.1 putative amino-acid permease [Clavispora lusitaniae]QFZ35511.1 putative amino-acid permease [Clavispora lusitaniae]QFZ41205.1 putative amino-acid permease [Clavispora lusitaniae]QFZ46886.1 putative amino-acid permease [Clavispora lusitaniae]
MTGSDLSKTSSPDIVTITTEPTRWQRFQDSFKRAEESSSEDLASLNTLERAVQKTAHSQLKSTIGPISQAFIALGGCVGSGLLIVSGKALYAGGPAGVLIAWFIVSTFLYCVMQALAELSSTFPVSGSFAVYATRFIDPSFGFAAGWNYAMFWVIVLPLELVAASLTINFWNSHINSVVWVAIFYVLILVLNLFGSAGFEYFELVSSIIKLLGIVGFNILAIVLICGGGDEGFIGAKKWEHTGAFAHGFKGVVSVLVTATYSLAGTELVSMTAAESRANPRIALPHAIKMVFYRILVFYMITLTLITFLVASDNSKLVGGSNALASPFVIAIQAGGIKALPSIFNVIVLVALLSIGNSAVYGFSRTILSLAEQGLAPKIFLYVDRCGRPLVGVAVSAIVGLLAFVSASPKQAEVFNWLVALSALSTLFTWASCTIAHIRFRAAMHKQNRSLTELPYLSQTGTWGSWYATICLIVILALQFWISLFPLGQSPDAKVFFENYLGAVIAVLFYVGHKIYSRKLNTIVPLETMDLDTGRRETDFEKLNQELAEEKMAFRTLPWYKKLYQVLF